MAVVTETGSFAVPAERLWELVSDFGGIAKYMDGVDECVVEGEGIGALRKIPIGNDHVVESLDVLDLESLTLVYSMVSGPMPFRDYSASMVVTRDGEEPVEAAAAFVDVIIELLEIVSLRIAPWQAPPCRHVGR